MLRLICLVICLAGAARAQDRAGEFDYYVMALSWSPNWCALEGDRRGSDQCDARHDYGWILHGLWPQYERGYPADCRSSVRNPSRGETNAMTDIMASGGLAWHQWKKHGRCSGLTSEDYFELSRDAYAQVTRPPVFRKLEDPVKLPAKVVEDAFLEANSDLSRDQITITCKSRHIQEVRICLTKDLEFRNCGGDVIRDCTATDAMFNPVR